MFRNNFLTKNKTKKFLGQEVRQKSDILEHRSKGSFAPFNPYFVCNTAAGSLCDLLGVILLQK